VSYFRRMVLNKCPNISGAGALIIPQTVKLAILQ